MSTSQLDINTAASLVAVVSFVGGGWRISHAVARWKDSTDAHLKAQDEQMKAQGERLDKIEKELKPNGGGSHHDVIVREIRSAVSEMEHDRELRDLERRRRRPWWV